VSNPMYDPQNAPMSREGMQMQYPPYPTDPYGYPPRRPFFGYGMRRMRGSMSTETKPFYLTSEFLLSVLISLGIAISAATMRAFGGWRAWILITAILVSYNLSRGIAKSGIRSRAYDPREELQLGRGLLDHAGQDGEHQTHVTGRP
jgi:hypothetical protein